MNTMNELATIYTVTNTSNNMVYVGSTAKAIEDRFGEHIRRSRRAEGTGLFYDDIRAFSEDVFLIESIDHCLLHHRFIIEEHHWHSLNDSGVPLYDIKRGASHSKNTVQRLAYSRQNNGFDYSSEEFKDKMSLATTGEKNGMYNMKDEDAVNGRAVYAMDENKKVVHSFPSVKVALKFLDIKGHSALNKACRTGQKYKNYYWKKEWIDR